MDLVALIPLRTHVIGPGEDLAGIVRRYTRLVARAGDIVAVAESVVAITQGRLVLPEEIRPGRLARFLSRFPGKDGSLTSPQTMQLVINTAGRARVLLGAVLALAGRLVGKRGLFYAAVGPEVKLIDDVSGTMPPFERHIVLGPADADLLAEEVRAGTGLPLLVVDVNDLGRVDLVGQSTGLDPDRRDECLRALRANPFGNADEQTPLVLIRPTGPALR